MEYLMVGVGGVLGSLARFAIGSYISGKSAKIFPVGTFMVNISGALLLGIVADLGMGHNLYILLADGFLGAYTTFSTFMYEGFNLFQDNEKLNAVIYIVGTLILGIIGFVAGVTICNFFN